MITSNDTEQGILSSGPVLTVWQWHGRARKATHCYERGVERITACVSNTENKMLLLTAMTK